MLRRVLVVLGAIVVLAPLVPATQPLLIHWKADRTAHRFRRTHGDRERSHATLARAVPRGHTPWLRR